MLTLIRDVQILAPKPLGSGDLLLAGGRIASVGPRLEPPTGVDCAVIEGGGRTAIPGLVDVHAHLAGGGGEGGAHTRVPAPAFSAFSTAGVTTVVGLLGTDATTRSPGELLAAARALEHHGLTAFCYTGSYRLPPPTITGSVRGDLVHVDRMVAVGELAVSDHRSSQPTFEELARIASDAHVAGLMTGKAGLVHVHLGDGPRGLELLRRVWTETELPVRALHPTHLNRNRTLWAEALDVAEAHRAYLDVTCFPPGDPGPSAATCIAGYLSGGHDPRRITASSDGGGCLPRFDREGALESMDVGTPHTLLRTVAELIQLGIAPHKAIAPFTANPAALFRFTGKGRLEVGADADVVLVDPQWRPVHVFAGGRALVREGQAVVRGNFEPAQ